MNYILTLVIATASLYAGAWHLGQSLDSYWDFVAFAVVLGGTFSVAIAILPWGMKKELRSVFRRLLFNSKPKQKDFLTVCLKVIEVERTGAGRTPVYGKTFDRQVLREGIELLALGFSTQKIKDILEERIFQYHSRMKTIGNSVRSLAKYPPAFGLAGTVLGLVHLMHGVAEGISAEETGIRMAIALVATFYGLLVANLVISPAGETIVSFANDDVKEAEIALATVVLASEKTNMLEAQETLNSYAAIENRVDMIQQAIEAEAA